MLAAEFMAELASRGITVRAIATGLKAHPASKLTPCDVDAIRYFKADILDLLLVAERTDADGRVTCLRCHHRQGSDCANYRAAGLASPEVGHTLAALPQHCPGFKRVQAAANAGQESVDAHA